MVPGDLFQTCDYYTFFDMFCDDILQSIVNVDKGMKCFVIGRCRYFETQKEDVLFFMTQNCKLLFVSLIVDHDQPQVIKLS
jgi:hypothetical protein